MISNIHTMRYRFLNTSSLNGGRMQYRAITHACFMTHVHCIELNIILLPRCPMKWSLYTVSCSNLPHFNRSSLTRYTKLWNVNSTKRKRHSKNFYLINFKLSVHSLYSAIITKSEMVTPKQHAHSVFWYAETKSIIMVQRN